MSETKESYAEKYQVLIQELAGKKFDYDQLKYDILKKYLELFNKHGHKFNGMYIGHTSRDEWDIYTFEVPKHVNIEHLIYKLFQENSSLSWTVFPGETRWLLHPKNELNPQNNPSYTIQNTSELKIFARP